MKEWEKCFLETDSSCAEVNYTDLVKSQGHRKKGTSGLLQSKPLLKRRWTLNSAQTVLSSPSRSWKPGMKNAQHLCASYATAWVSSCVKGISLSAGWDSPVSVMPTVSCSPAQTNVGGLSFVSSMTPRWILKNALRTPEVICSRLNKLSWICYRYVELILIYILYTVSRNAVTTWSRQTVPSIFEGI